MRERREREERERREEREEKREKRRERREERACNACQMDRWKRQDARVGTHRVTNWHGAPEDAFASTDDGMHVEKNPGMGQRDEVKGHLRLASRNSLV